MLRLRLRPVVPPGASQLLPISAPKLALALQFAVSTARYATKYGFWRFSSCSFFIERASSSRMARITASSAAGEEAAHNIAIARIFFMRCLLFVVERRRQNRRKLLRFRLLLHLELAEQQSRPACRNRNRPGLRAARAVERRRLVVRRQDLVECG